MLDIDECCGGECDGILNFCEGTASCINTEGGYTCDCPGSWMSTGDGFGCTGMSILTI